MQFTNLDKDERQGYSISRHAACALKQALIPLYQILYSYYLNLSKIPIILEQNLDKSSRCSKKIRTSITTPVLLNPSNRLLSSQFSLSLACALPIHQRNS